PIRFNVFALPHLPGQLGLFYFTLRRNKSDLKHFRTLRGQNSPENAARERSRVRNLRQAFHSLQAALPSVPPDTKLSKLDVLVLATNYIAYLTETLDQGRTLAEHTLPSRPCGYLHPVKVRIRANILPIFNLILDPKRRRRVTSVASHLLQPRCF
uniref:Transcription factor 23 n=1 Tax=Sparus aurata TaxID=8175 RepID=A0A671TUR1_SPAAU